MRIGAEGRARPEAEEAGVEVEEELTGGGRQHLLDWKAPGTLVDPGGVPTGMFG